MTIKYLRTLTGSVNLNDSVVSHSAADNPSFQNSIHGSPLRAKKPRSRNKNANAKADVCFRVLVYAQ